MNDFPELPPDGPWLVPGVSAARLSTPDTLSTSLRASGPFHPGSAAAAMCSRRCSERITRPWVTPDSAQVLTNSRKPCRPSSTTRGPKVISSQTDVWAVIRGSDDVSVLSLPCVFRFHGLSYRSVPPLPLTPHFVSGFSYTSQVTRHHTSWLLSPQLLSFDFIPALSCWGRDTQCL